MSSRAALEKSLPLQRYYRVLQEGVDAYQDGRDLLPLLTDDFVFDGPIAGRMAGGTRFSYGVRGFIEAVRAIEFLQVIGTESGAAVLYDAELPSGTVRFSEFFEFDNDRIRELRIQYNAADYVAAGGR